MTHYHLITEIPRLAESDMIFTFDGRRLNARAGDTIAAALWRNGIKVITRSMKFHRPRGLYCGTGDCPNCLANVNGIPNVRICITPVEDGMQVVPQNKFLSRNFDPIGIMDRLYQEGFNYHHKFIRPRFASGIYQKIIRRMTGIGRLPTAKLRPKSTLRMNFDVAIIGDEPHALRIAEICSEENLEILIARNAKGSEPIEQKFQNRKNVKSIKHATIVGAFDDGSIGIRSEERLFICRSKAISISERGKELPLRFGNWDMPGIIQKSAAVQLMEQEIPLGKNIVVTGNAETAINFVDTIMNKGMKISAILCDSSKIEGFRDRDSGILRLNWSVEAALGRKELKKIAISNGRSTEILPCDCLITCGPIVPNIELARQLGCAIRTDNKFIPYVAVNEVFETSRKGIFAVGSSTGQMNLEKSWEDASTASKAIVQRARELRK